MGFLGIRRQCTRGERAWSLGDYSEVGQQYAVGSRAVLGGLVAVYRREG